MFFFRRTRNQAAERAAAEAYSSPRPSRSSSRSGSIDSDDGIVMEFELQDIPFRVRTEVAEPLQESPSFFRTDASDLPPPIPALFREAESSPRDIPQPVPAPFTVESTVFPQPMSDPFRMEPVDILQNIPVPFVSAEATQLVTEKPAAVSFPPLSLAPVDEPSEKQEGEGVFELSEEGAPAKRPASNRGWLSHIATYAWVR